MARSAVFRVLSMYQLYGSSDYIGEGVSQTQHALQTAWLAQQHTLDPQFITAAFCHDIGHLLGFNKGPGCVISSFARQSSVAQMKAENGQSLGVRNHEMLGADYLNYLGYSPFVCYLVRNHVNAKRWLATTDTNYQKRLSPASFQTLQMQGGLMSQNEMSRFQQHEWWRKSVFLRQLEDRAKNINIRNLPTLQSLIPYLQNSIPDKEGEKRQ